MRFALFYHSLVSDWNHGNAHFLRGVAAELGHRGHPVHVYEPAGGWSLANLRGEAGEAAVEAFRDRFPGLSSTAYDPAALDLDAALEDMDVVIVHEWNDPAFIARIGRHHADAGGYRLLFHDTHHRLVSDPSAIGRHDLSAYDGVLAFGEVLRAKYARHPGVRRAWTWHEAADTRVFRPLEAPVIADLTWVGNWGDGERAQELQQFLIEPVAELRLSARVYGVRYPPEALAALEQAGIPWGGWVPNYRVPELFAQSRCTVHVPRRFYREQLPGIPTIRVFEALACRIPLVCAPWEDQEGLFRPGEDFLVARDGAEMRHHLRDLRQDPAYARAIARQGYERVLARHTCAHRTTELLAICAELGAGQQPDLPVAVGA